MLTVRASPGCLSHLFFTLVRSRHVNSRAYKIYWASYLEDGALVRISILFFLLITHAGDLSSAGKVRVSRFFFGVPAGSRYL